MSTDFEPILSGLAEGRVVPFLGPGALAGVTSTATGETMPADSHSLILALNNGQPMSPKLMFEFSRAAMHVELKRGRSALTKFLDKTYRDTAWSPSALHLWLAEQGFPYVVDTNRDTQLQLAMASRPHTLVVGLARMAGAEHRFKVFQSDGKDYAPVSPDQVDSRLPVLFKPVGSPLPEASYIASDADFVDYLTELMGGFAIPGFIKRRRPGLRYLLLGLRLNRDTERMLLSEIGYAAGSPAGWALIPSPTDKERRFLERLNYRIIPADVGDFLAAAGVPVPAAARQAA